MSNLVDLPPNDKSGMYKAPSHSEGGFRLVIDNAKVAEAEGYEIELCPSVLESNEILHYKNKTNKQILDDIFQKNACVMTQGYTTSGSFIVCKKAVLDDTKKDFNGSVKDFLNSIQSEHGCKVTEDAKEEFKKEKGGKVSNKELKKGIKVEEEHRDTVEKLAKGEISADEGVKEIAKSHLAEDPAYYNKLEVVESPFYKFIEIVDTSKGFNEAYSKAKQIKDVPDETATLFYEKYNPEGKLSMEESFRKFYDEHKKDGLDFKVTEQELPYKGNPNAKWVKVTHVTKDGETLMQGVAIDLYGSKEKAVEVAKEKIKSILKKESEKQELQDLIDLFKEAVKENPNDQESKDLLELYEENLKEFGSENKDIDFSFGSKKKDKFSIEEKGNIVFVNINSGKYKGGYIYNKSTGKLDSDNGERKDIKYYLVSQGVISESLKKTEKISIEKEHHHDIIDIEGRKFNGHYILADGKRVGAIDWRFVGANQEIILLERIEIYPKYRGNDYAKKAIDVLFKEDKLANGIIVDAVKSSIPAWVKIGFIKEGYVAEKGLMRYEMTKDAFYKKNPELIDKFSLGGSINRKLTYLGEVGGDKIGQKSSLEKAKSLEKQGISNEEIRQETGWFVNTYDKKWRFEISDEDFRFIYNFEDAKKYFNENKDKTFFKKKLSDIIRHDKFFLAYPEFKNIPFYFFNEKKTTLAAVFIPENKEKEIFIIYNLYDEKSRIEHARGIKSTKSTNETWVSELLRISDIISGGSRLNYRPISNDVYRFRRNIIAHELQHLIQIREEFGAGSSSEWWYEEIIRKRGIYESKLSEIERNNLLIESKLYSKNSSGEIEAMDIDLRLDFNDKERNGIIPLSLITVNPDFVTVDLEEPRFENGGELNAEETILNAPCINKKFNFVESSDYNEFRKGGSINGMSKAELKEFYNTKEGKELDRQTHDKWKKLVNMSKNELETFYNSEEGKEAGLSASEAKEKGIDSGRESARWILKMKDIPYTEWTPEMWRWAKKQINFISRMSGMKGDLYDDKGNKTRKHTALLIWGHDPEKYEEGGAISFDKVISASTRFRPSETVVFDPPLEGKNGAKLISYTWSYEWTMTPNYEGELKSKRVSDWSQAEISADTGRDIVHQYTILMTNGEYKTVSSDSVPVLLGYLDKKELKSFPNLVTASKTLAKQQMQLAILEAQKKEYDDLYAKFEKAEKPEIKEVDETSKFSAAKESWDKGAYSNYAMGDIVYRQDNDYVYETKEYKKRPITKDTIEQLTYFWISKRVEESGGINPRGLYDLKNRVARQKRKVENILNTKMELGGEINKVNSLKELLKLDKEDAINIIESILRSDSFYSESKNGSFYEMAKSSYVVCNDLLKFNKKNPIKTKMGDLAYFEPDYRLIARDGYFVAQIKYAAHQVTHLMNGKRIFDSSKNEDYGVLMECLLNPDDRAVNSMDENKVYYHKVISTKQSGILVFEAVLDKLGLIKHITIMPNKTASHWNNYVTGNNQKGEIRYSLASPLVSPLSKSASEDEINTKETPLKTTDFVKVSNGSTNIQIKNDNMQEKNEKNEKFSQGGEIEDIIVLLEPYEKDDDEFKRSMDFFKIMNQARINLESIKGDKPNSYTNEEFQVEVDRLSLEKDNDDIKGTLLASGGKIEVNKVSVYQTAFYGLSFADLGGYFESKFTDVIDLEDENVILKDAPIFLFFKNPYDTRYSEKISIDDVIGAIIPKKMEKDARTIFDKRFISYVTYSDDSTNEHKIEAIKKLADINEDIILK